MARIAFARNLMNRGTFAGIFGGIARPGSRPRDMILLRNIKDADGLLVTDHLWFNVTKRFSELNLRLGDHVRFDARVRIYVRKGGSTDYHLSYPTRIVKI